MEALHEEQLDMGAQAKVANCKRNSRSFVKVKILGKQVRAKVRWRNKGDTMSFKFFNLLVKEKSQLALRGMRGLRWQILRV